MFFVVLWEVVSPLRAIFDIMTQNRENRKKRVPKWPYFGPLEAFLKVKYSKNQGDDFEWFFKVEWISKGMLRFCSTALTKRLREEQVRGWISITIEDMTMILFPAYRSIRGGGLNYSRNFDLTSCFFCRWL